MNAPLAATSQASRRTHFAPWRSTRTRTSAPANAPYSLRSTRRRLEWTFPPAFAEVIWGDGGGVRRRRVDLSEHPPFSGVDLRVRVDLKGAKWVRLEAWDVAANGAFSQPVWVE